MKKASNFVAFASSFWFLSKETFGTPMKIIHRVFVLAFGALTLPCFVHSASAVLVTWNLNPDNLNQDVGSASRTYTQSGYQITALGYDNISGPDTPHSLFYKSAGSSGGATEIGLGLSGVFNNELQVNHDGSATNYIQLDIRSILSQGFTNGMISVGSVQAGESFRLYGSNTQGSLGSQIGGVLDSSVDNQFVNVPNFGTYGFISVVSVTDDVLPVAFRASVPQPVPEVASVVPIGALLAAVAGLAIIRRKRTSLSLE